MPCVPLLRRARFAAIAATVAAGLLPAGPFALGIGTVTAATSTLDPSLASPQLARAPYLTDLTQTSVEVVWATTAQGHGTLQWGPPGNCAQNTLTAGAFMQLNVAPTGYTRYDYQDTFTIGGLAPSTTYCYRVFARDGTDLLGSGNPSPSFTTLDPVDTSSLTPLTFDVVGDFGDNTDSSGVASATSVNTSQQAIDAAIAASGARFVLGVGDIAYQDGSQSNYGDLEETGTNAPGGTAAQLTEISNIFGPQYWAQIQNMPMFAADGNHGQNNNILRVWPETSTVAASAGAYAMDTYPAIDGASSGTYPDAWYGFSSGNVRIYVLDASWPDSNPGVGTGSLCAPLSGGLNPCATYQMDHDQHWTATSAEYQWLQADLQSHPGGVKFAVFHFPLRSDNATQASDPYLQNTSAIPNSLEALLSANAVTMAFNGHTHIYQRNVPTGPGQLISYVTGGGGGKVEPVGTGSTPCSSTDAYAVGWSFSAGQGSACGAAAKPTSPAAVYHFLKVTVSGTTVTVAPQNALGQTFDVQTYSVGPAATPLLSEGFESGSLAGWQPVVGGVSVQSQVIHTGSYAAQISSTGGQSFALRGLTGSGVTGALYAQAWVDVASQTTSATLFGLRKSSAQVLQVYLAANGLLKVRNNVSATNYAGTLSVSPGWHRVTLSMNESAGTFAVALDGQNDPALSQTGQNLGSAPVTTFQLGDDSTGRTYSWYSDDITVSTTPPTS